MKTALCLVYSISLIVASWSMAMNAEKAKALEPTVETTHQIDSVSHEIFKKHCEKKGHHFNWHTIIITVKVSNPSLFSHKGKLGIWRNPLPNPNGRSTQKLSAQEEFLRINRYLLAQSMSRRILILNTASLWLKKMALARVLILSFRNACRSITNQIGLDESSLSIQKQCHEDCCLNSYSMFQSLGNKIYI